MAAFISVRLDELFDRVHDALVAARARAHDLRPALRAIGQAGVRQTRLRFATGRDPQGRSWKPGRKAQGQTLIASGLLRNSVSAREPSDGAVEWGSNRIYAGVHQFGATIRAKRAKTLRFRLGGGNGAWVSVKQVTIPARPFLGINSEDLAEFSRIILRHLGEPLVGSVA